MKKFLVLIALMVVITPLFETFNVGQVKANTVVQDEGVEGDLIFEQNDENGIIYTYSENGKDYRVVETFENNQTAASSEIYEYNEQVGDYVIIDKIFTSSNEDQTIVTQTSEFSGEVSTVDVQNEIESNDGQFDLDTVGTMARASAWYYNTTYNGSTSFATTRWTVSAVAILIASVTKLPGTAKAVTSIAAMTINMNAKTIYYTRHAYRDNNASKNRPNVKYITHIYKNSAKTIPIKTNVVSYACSSYCTKN